VIRQWQPNDFFILRPTPDEAIEFRPYEQSILFPHIKTLIKRLQPKVSTPLRFRNRQLPRVRGVGRVWMVYLTAHARRELWQLAPREHIPTKYGLI